MPDLPPPSVLVVPAAVIGLVMGSFVTALSYRQPRAQSIAHGRSKCPACRHTLGPVDLVPVFSWLIQRGACRYCRTRISGRYPAIELATMALFAAGALIVADPIRLGLLAVMTVVMMALAVIDLEEQRLPNSFLVVLLILSLAWRWEGDREILTGLASAAVVYAVGTMLGAGFRFLTGREGLGGGDTKLMAVAALAFSVGPLLLVLTAAGILGLGSGLLWRRRAGGGLFPFGPAILTAYWAGLAGGDAAFAWVISQLS